jgi:hypothetical protein
MEKLGGVVNDYDLSASQPRPIIEIHPIMKQLALATLIASAAMVGCTNYDTHHHGRNVSMEPRHNFLGLVKVEAGSYAPSDKATVGMNMREMYGHRLTSGDRVTLFWGAVTLTDY